MSTMLIRLYVISYAGLASCVEEMLAHNELSRIYDTDNEPTATIQNFQHIVALYPCINIRNYTHELRC